MLNKEQIALGLAQAHRETEPMISRIVRLLGDQEEQPTDPIKLLEVNPATSPSGIVPIAFSPDPPSVPYPSVVIEVTEDEFDRIQGGELGLPWGWRIGPTLYSQNGG